MEGNQKTIEIRKWEEEQEGRSKRGEYEGERNRKAGNRENKINKKQKISK